MHGGLLRIMDDDLMSLRGSSPPPGDDDLFDFSSGDTANQPVSPPGGGASDPFDFMSPITPTPASDPFDLMSDSAAPASNSAAGSSFDLDFGSTPAAPAQSGGLLDDLDMPAAAPEPAPKTAAGKKTLFGGAGGRQSAPVSGKGKSKSKGKKKSSGFMGLSPFQSMILSVFLFLDISVMGLMMLVAIGAIAP
jgi:hypothetical protein